MLRVQGMIVSQRIDKIKPRQGGKQFDPFDLKTMYISDGKSRPIEVQSTNINGTKVGEKVELDVFISLWRGDAKGYTLKEVRPRGA